MACRAAETASGLGAGRRVSDRRREKNSSMVELRSGSALADEGREDSERLENGFFGSTIGVRAHFRSENGLAPGKLNFALGLGGDAVAHRGTIAPGANGLENRLIVGSTGALEDQRAMHAAVGAHDKTNPHLERRITRIEYRVGSGQSLGGICLLAARTGGSVRHVGKLGVMHRDERELALPSGDGFDTRDAQCARSCGCERGARNQCG